MKPKSSLPNFLALAGSSLLAVSSASAADLFWSADGTSQGGAGTWDTSNARWGSVAAGSYGTTWNNTTNASDTAVFGSTAGAVALGTPITAGGLTFSTTGYSITGSTLTLTGASAPIINVTGTATISSAIAGTNGFSKTGTGNLILSGDNTYTGVTTLGLATGQITVAHNNALGSTVAGSHTTITNNGNNNHWIMVNTGITTPENITLTGTGLPGYDSPLRAAGTGTYSGTITLNVNRGMRIGPANWTGTITGTITKIDAANPTLTFVGNNSVSNPITIGGANLSVMNGTTTLNAVNGTGIGDTNIYRDGGTAVLVLGVTNALRTDGNLSYGGGTGRLNLNGNNQTIKGLISSGTSTWTVNNDANNGSTSTLTVGNGGGDYSFSGTIINATTGNGIVALVKTGAGNQTLTGINTFTGGTRVDDGTLTLGHATDTLANTGAINVNGGTLALGANNDTVGAVTLTSGSITGSGGTLTGSSYDVRSGSVSAILGGTGALTKSTAGTATLTGANSYSGGTTVSAGTLLINGSTSASSAVTVETGGTLGGAGTIAGAVSVDGALSPGNNTGNSTGLLSVGSLNLNANSSTTLEINGTDRGAVTDGYDALGVGTGGSIDLSGSLNFVFGNLAAFTNGSDFDLFSFDTTSTGDFTSVTSTGFYTGTWAKAGDVWSLDSGSQTLSFSEVTGNLTVIPEPKAAILGTLGLLALLRRRR